MRPEEDDEPGSGPPPDPSLRGWRHPSEIAAAARFSAQPTSPPPTPAPAPPSAASGLLAVAGAVAVVAGLMAVGLALGLGTGSDTLAAGPDDGTAERSETRGLFASDLRPPPVASTVTLANRTGTTPGSTGAGSPPAADSTPDTTPTSDATPVTTWAASGETIETTGKNQQNNSAPPGHGDPAPVDQSVSVVSNGTTIHLASFTVIDGMVFTAASAVAGHDPLTLTLGDFTASAQLAGVDPVNDLALLRIDDNEMSALVQALETADGRTAIHGDVIGRDHATKLATGQRVYGTLLTGAVRPPGCGGAPLADSEGSIVGMILHTNAALISALPIERLMEVGRTLSTWNLPSLAWLGIDGISSPRGGAELTSVSSGGPAALAGAQQGDRVVTFDGIEVQDWHHLIHLIRTGRTDSPVQLEIERDDASLAVTVTVGSRLNQMAAG